MFLIAHNIRSLHNVGSIFRSADAFGIDRLYLTGYTGRPPRKEIAKVALGSENRVPWEAHDDVFSLINQLKAGGVRIIALENAPNAVDIEETDRSEPFALVLGNEVDGIEPLLLSYADAVVFIPMPGGKKSLNVSVAAGVALFELTRKMS